MPDSTLLNLRDQQKPQEVSFAGAEITPTSVAPIPSAPPNETRGDDLIEQVDQMDNPDEDELVLIKRFQNSQELVMQKASE